MVNRKKYTEFLGVYTTGTMDASLRIQALLQGVGVSSLVRNIIQTYFDNNDLSEEKLITRYANSAYTLWYFKYREVTSFKDHLKQVRIDLSGILPETLIELIITECGELRKSP